MIALQNLTGKLDAVIADVATLKTQTVEKSEVVKETIPSPRQIVIKTKDLQPAKPESIQQIALRSVMNKQ